MSYEGLFVDESVPTMNQSGYLPLLQPPWVRLHRFVTYTEGMDGNPSLWGPLDL